MSLLKFRLVVTICYDDTFNVLRITFNHSNSMHDIPCETFFWNWIERAFVASLDVLDVYVNKRVLILLFFSFGSFSCHALQKLCRIYTQTMDGSRACDFVCKRIAPFFPSTSEPPHTQPNNTLNIPSQCTRFFDISSDERVSETYVCISRYMWRTIYIHRLCRLSQSFRRIPSRFCTLVARLTRCFQTNTTLRNYIQGCAWTLEKNLTDLMTYRIQFRSTKWKRFNANEIETTSHSLWFIYVDNVRELISFDNNRVLGFHHSGLIIVSIGSDVVWSRLFWPAIGRFDLSTIFSENGILY